MLRFSAKKSLEVEELGLQDAASCCSVFGGVQYYVEYVVSAEQDVAVVSEQLFLFAFGCSLKEYVHVPVALDHFSLVFASVFEDDFDVSV